MKLFLPNTLSSGMVLQRNTKVNLWGLADKTVTIRFLGRCYTAEPDAAGRWLITLDNLPPGGPHVMRIGDEELHDVYIGDVWLCGGQSNMQWTMSSVRYMFPEDMQAVNPAIRQLTVPQQMDFHAPIDDLGHGAWHGVSPAAIGDFSAVGYFFAKHLHQCYGVPIGLIQAAIGGTPIHAWMSRSALAAFPEALNEADRCTDNDYITRVRDEDAARTAEFHKAIDQTDPGLMQKWYAKDYDDDDWETRLLLQPWSGACSVWYRKTVAIPPAMAKKSAVLFLGTVMDADTVYFNGQPIGKTEDRYTQRAYFIPELPEGRCVITMRILSKNGGGFTAGKQYMLSTDAGSFDLSGSWRFHPGGAAEPPPQETLLHNMPTGLYNGMIHPLRKHTIRGAIWYQGETDASKPERYAEKFAAMARLWRNDWGYDFPLLFVELAHWEEGQCWDELRRQQRLALHIPGTAMAAAFDLGEYNDVHPQDKRTVGERLARCAMRVAYHETLPPSPFEIVAARHDMNAFLET